MRFDIGGIRSDRALWKYWAPCVRGAAADMTDKSA
eukprot:COSAG05_NODE_15061_length_379_cov_1.071429_2_plen_34_part_01